MSELENKRSNFKIGQHDAFLMTQHPQPLNSSALSTHQDNHGAVVYWSQIAAGPIQGTSNTSEAKPDAVDDSDDEEENRPFTPPPPRERLSYTRYQLELLNGIYEKVRYPNYTQKLLVAKRVGITREQVKVWFQNRRRKDVVGNVTKSKIDIGDTNGSGTSDLTSMDSEAQNTCLVAGKALSEDINSRNDVEVSVVPTAVMKSVIGELLKFTEDPLKGKKNRQNSKRIKSKDRNNVKEAAATTCLSGNYDIVSPPNQITPTAYNIDNVKTGFNHSLNSSAFVYPRGSLQPAQINKITSTCRSSPEILSIGPSILGSMKNLPMSANNFVAPFHGVTGPYRTFGVNSRFSSFLPRSSIGRNDIPVLSDILSSRSPTHIMSSANSSYMNSSVPTASRNQAYEQNYAPFLQNRLLNGMYTYPLSAERPASMSSLRSPDSIYRPSYRYHLPHFSDDPYHPLYITPLPNPYSSLPSASLQSPSVRNSTTYKQL